ncbi:MAG: hypothetical protein JOZ31_02725 [Verrucomicrobia bacterium]|nr:hypothetical protein [Verrucomicrobiota bacterium]
MKSYGSLCITLRAAFWATVFCLSFAKVAKGSITDDLKFETSDLMKKAAYHNPDRIAADVAADGALGKVNIAWDQTHTGIWYIEEQRYGMDAVTAGIADDDAAAIDRGLKAFRWGFEQQQTDGSFSCPDAFHSTSFFVEATSHACLLLEASSFRDRYASQVDWLKPRILKAALWMINPAVEEAGRRHNARYTHRRYLVAAALGEAGVLCGNQTLIDKSKEYIREGVSLQSPAGYNPEKGGYDCSYHAVGLVFAERYCDVVADSETKKELYPMLKRANEWLKTRIQPDGTIDPTGNTRTGLSQEKGRGGEYKKVSYAQTVRTFYRWSLMSDDPAYTQLADRVIEGERISKRQAETK